MASTSPWEQLGELDEYGELCRVRREHLVEVREPLVLISQIQRSGGTLLSQLLDAHPECHAHPGEIYIGKPKKWNWPPLDLAAPERWFETLYEPLVGDYLQSGYVKEAPAKGSDVEPDIFPFLFSPRLQKAIFDRCVASRPVHTERDVLDWYFTSYFNAWLDNHNLYGRPKKIVAGFTPRLTMEAANIERFFSVYPDGKLISIVRNPRAWYVSAYTHRRYYRRDPDETIELWCRSARAALGAREQYGDRVLVLTYEQLVSETETTMRSVAERIGIAMSPELLEPTFNGRPIRANSVVRVDQHGILRERIEAGQESLDRETIARIDEQAGDLYAQATAVARSLEQAPVA